jgi:hypothetical protein
MNARGSSDGRGGMEVADDGRGRRGRVDAVMGRRNMKDVRETVTIEVGIYSDWV